MRSPSDWPRQCLACDKDFVPAEPVPDPDGRMKIRSSKLCPECAERARVRGSAVAEVVVGRGPVGIEKAFADARDLLSERAVTEAVTRRRKQENLQGARHAADRKLKAEVLQLASNWEPSETTRKTRAERIARRLKVPVARVLRILKRARK